MLVTLPKRKAPLTCRSVFVSYCDVCCMKVCAKYPHAQFAGSSVLLSITINELVLCLAPGMSSPLRPFKSSGQVERSLSCMQ